jgi:hypothetical protein
MKTFRNREELKWHFHGKLCKGDSNAEYLMNAVFDNFKVEKGRTKKRVLAELNEWLEPEGYRVEEL